MPQETPPGRPAGKGRERIEALEACLFRENPVGLRRRASPDDEVGARTYRRARRPATGLPARFPSG